MCRYMLIYHLDETYEEHDSEIPVFRKMTNSLVKQHIANTLQNIDNMCFNQYLQN